MLTARIYSKHYSAMLRYEEAPLETDVYADMPNKMNYKYARRKLCFKDGRHNMPVEQFAYSIYIYISYMNCSTR